MLQIGLCCCYCWSCTFGNGSVYVDIHGALLHILAECNYHHHPENGLRSSQKIPQTAEYLYHQKCPFLHFLTTPACSYPLSLIHSLVWVTEWPLFINHRVETDKSCERALAPFESIQGTCANVTYNYVIGKACSFTLLTHAGGDTYW